MHDPMRAAKVNRRRVRLARPGRAGSNASRFTISLGEKPQGRINVEAGWPRGVAARGNAARPASAEGNKTSGEVFAWACRRTECSSASIGQTGDAGRESTAPKRTPEPDDAAVIDDLEGASPATSRKIRRPSQQSGKDFASQFQPAKAKRGRAVIEAGNDFNNARHRAQTSEEAKQAFLEP